MLSMNIVMLFILTGMEAIDYDSQNANRMFQFYKDKYHKVYRNATFEKRGFKNFLRNLNKVNALNENSQGNDTYFVLNKYADIDQGDFEEHFALNLTPYDVSTLHREFRPVLPTDGLRHRLDRKPEAKSVENVELYDLDDADNLYKNYMKKFNKKNSTKAYDQTVHYYRFLKTLVEINRDHYKGSNKKLGENADLVKRPHDYFY